MLWNNKGHQFDGFYKEWSLDNEYYIWGTSTTTKSFYEKFEGLINIKGYIDNDKKKQGSYLNGKIIYSIEDIKDVIGKNKIIIASGAYNEISSQLMKYGLIEGTDFCDSRIFIGVYFSYVQNKVYIYRTDLSITSKCNLKCKSCNMFMPYYDSPRHKSFEEIKDDIDAYFKWVDNLQLLNILGGEPFLHPNIVEIIEYIGDRYYKKYIEHIEFFSNGTIKLSEEILSACKKYDIGIQVSDYSNKLEYLKEKVEEFIQTLSQNNIQVRRNISDKWLDFGYPNERNNLRHEEEMIGFFDKCRAPFRGLNNKKIYYCHLSSSAIQCNLFTENSNDYFDLSQYDESKKRELTEFDLGYNNNGYISFCKHCYGCDTVNERYVEVAEQINTRIGKIK